MNCECCAGAKRSRLTQQRGRMRLLHRIQWLVRCRGQEATKVQSRLTLTFLPGPPEWMVVPQSGVGNTAGADNGGRR